MPTKGCAWKHVKCIAPQHNRSGSPFVSALILVDEGSVRSSRPRLRCDCQKYYTCRVATHVFATTPSPIQASLVLSVQTSLCFRLRLVKHVFHPLKHGHLVLRERERESESESERASARGSKRELESERESRREWERVGERERVSV